MFHKIESLLKDFGFLSPELWAILYTFSLYEHHFAYYTEAVREIWGTTRETFLALTFSLKIISF